MSQKRNIMQMFLLQLAAVGSYSVTETTPPSAGVRWEDHHQSRSRRLASVLQLSC